MALDMVGACREEAHPWPAEHELFARKGAEAQIDGWLAGCVWRLTAGCIKVAASRMTRSCRPSRGRANSGVCWADPRLALLDACWHQYACVVPVSEPKVSKAGRATKNGVYTSHFR